MKILVLGGTRFLSEQIVEDALARGHKVTCANRGVTGTPPPGSDYVPLDRASDTDPDAGPWPLLAATRWDAVIDVASLPSWVRTAVAALATSTRRYTYVSTISVYADVSQPGTAAETPLAPPAEADMDMDGDPIAYGRNKVACEEIVRDAMPDTALVARPGLIVGPGDPSGRFSYWPTRLADGGSVLVPAPQDAPTQVIDVRDLASWLVTCAERGSTGTVDAVGPARSRRDFFAQVAAGVGADPDLVWADPDVLTELQVNPWAGPRSLPLWLPSGYAGMLDRDTGPATELGLSCRTLEQTAADTLAWLRGRPDSQELKAGLTANEEQTIIGALALKPRNRVVQAALIEAGLPGRIITLPGAATTAALAAEALGCEVGAIANSLVFWADGAPLLVMSSGARRVDTVALAQRLGKTSITRASAEQVRAATGQAIGGVAPVGHPEPLETVIDSSLATYPQLWAAGGTPHTVFPMTYPELVRLTGGVEVVTTTQPG